MKRYAFLLLLIITSCIYSCTKVELDGKWDPIKLSKAKTSFDSNGGSDTIESKNYKSWWINGIKVIDDETYYNVDSSNQMTVIGEGISANVEGNTVTITVEPSPDKHEWAVDMEAGDAFATIIVKQN